MTPEAALDLAIQEATHSTCRKSQRGVVLVGTAWITVAHNSPPAPFVCAGNEVCRSACRRVAVHAEERALLGAARRGWSTVGSFMVHVKVVDGAPVPSGPPSCLQCSRLILEAGVKTMYLLHESGLQAYTAVEFHELTLRHHGLTGTRLEDKSGKR